MGDYGHPIEKKIEDLRYGDQVLVSQLNSLSGKFSGPSFETILFVDLYPPSETELTIYTLTLQSGGSISMTHDHKVPILADDGTKVEIRADELVKGDQLA